MDRAVMRSAVTAKPIPPRSEPEQQFPLSGDYITLGQLLKAAGFIGSGGEARSVLAGGRVRVNGEIEMRRGRKLRAGDRVTAPGGPVVQLTEEPVDI